MLSYDLPNRTTGLTTTSYTSWSYATPIRTMKLRLGVYFDREELVSILVANDL